MVSITGLTNMQHALELTRLGLRISITRSLTGVCQGTLRQWWKEVHGARPPNGKLPETVLSFIRDQNSAAVISAYAALHTRIRPNDCSAEALLTTCSEFKRIFGSEMNINAAYYVTRDIRAHIVVFAHCTDCGAGYIYDTASRLTERCPFCGSGMDGRKRHRLSA